jgi:hypothetical protein
MGLLDQVRNYKPIKKHITPRSWSCQWGVRLCLWTAATNGLIIHAPGDMSMKNYGGMISAGEIPDSSTRAVWQSYQQSSSIKWGGTWWRKWRIWPYEVFLFGSDFFTCRKILHGDDGFVFLSEGRRAADFYRSSRRLAMKLVSRQKNVRF